MALSNKIKILNKARKKDKRKKIVTTKNKVKAKMYKPKIIEEDGKLRRTDSKPLIGEAFYKKFKEMHLAKTDI